MLFAILSRIPPRFLLAESLGFMVGPGQIGLTLTTQVLLHLRPLCFSLLLLAFVLLKKNILYVLFHVTQNFPLSDLHREITTHFSSVC